MTFLLKSYCTNFQHALKLVEITGIVLTRRMSKTSRKKRPKGLKVIRNLNFYKLQIGKDSYDVI